MKLIYGIKDKPKFGKLIVFAFQQLLAIMAATIAVPMITSGVYDCGNVQMSTVAALFELARAPLYMFSSRRPRAPFSSAPLSLSSAQWQPLSRAQQPSHSAISA